MSNNGKYWLLAFSVLYVGAFAIAVFNFHLPFKDLIPVALCFGVIFPLIALIFLKKSISAPSDKPFLKKEWILLPLLIAWVVFYTTYGSALINQFLPADLTRNERALFFVVLIKKIIVFVLIPFLIYRSLGFTVADFGFKLNKAETFSFKNILAFIFLTILILTFQCFFSRAPSTLQTGEFKIHQLIIGLSLTFTWLFIEVGLVEEFFFRAVLQSRISALFRSQLAGIFISVVVFALAHVPGLFLRGASSEGVIDSMPFGFWIVYCIVNMSAAGIFLGITWSRTRNLYLVMALHAITDLLPNLADFIHTWKI
jgi:membrane protease YdiL (CAAX protease family)